MHLARLCKIMVNQIYAEEFLCEELHLKISFPPMFLSHSNGRDFFIGQSGADNLLAQAALSNLFNYIKIRHIQFPSPLLSFAKHHLLNLWVLVAPNEIYNLLIDTFNKFFGKAGEERVKRILFSPSASVFTMLILQYRVNLVSGRSPIETFYY